MDTIHSTSANRGAGTAPVCAAADDGDFRANGLDRELIHLPGHRSTHLNPSRPGSAAEPSARTCAADREPLARREREGLHRTLRGSRDQALSDARTSSSRHHI